MRLGTPPEWDVPDGPDKHLTEAMISACLQGSLDSFKQLHDSSEASLIPPPSYLVRLASTSRSLPMLNHILKLYPLRYLRSVSSKKDSLPFPDRQQHINYAMLSAITRGDVVIVQRLLKAGIPLAPYIEDHYNRMDTLLERAVHDDQVEVARLLLQKGADPDSEVWGIQRRTCVSLAALLQNDAMLLLLLEYGGKIEDSHALWAIATGGYPVGHAERLLELGANINEVFTYGWILEPTGTKGTALHAAAAVEPSGYAESIELANFLLQHGIDYTIKNGNGQTAMQVAEERGYTHFTRLIEDWIQHH